MLRIPRKLTDAVIDHAYEGFPNEVCGILGGKGGVVSSLFRLTNAHGGKHFVVDPAESLAVINRMREEGLAILAIYHSHPNGPPRPAPEDNHLALTGDISFIIISLMKLDNPVLKSYRITDSHFVPEDVEYL